MLGRQGGRAARLCVASLVLSAVALAASGCFGGGGPQLYGSIDGYVYYHATARGTDEAGEPKPELIVTRSSAAPTEYAPLEGARVVAGSRVAWSNADGYFILTSIAAGVYDVSVSHERFIMGLKFLGVEVTAGRTTHLSDAQVGSFFYLIIGINDYPGESDLYYCVADAEALEQSLWGDNGYAGEVVLLTDAQAHKDDIEAAMASIGNRMNAQDYFVMTFSGHGGYQDDQSEDPVPPGDDSQEYLVAADGVTITDDELTEWAQTHIPTDYCLFVFDSCYSGGMTKSVSDASAPEWMRGYKPGLSGLARDLNQHGYVVLMACDDGEASLEAPELGQGVFTYYLCEGIDTMGADFNADGFITARELFTYAGPKVATYAAQHDLPPQTPQLYASPDSRADIPIYYSPW